MTSKGYDCVYWYSGGWALGTWRAVFGVVDLEACADDLRRQGYCVRLGSLSVGPPEGVPEELEHATDAEENIASLPEASNADALRHALRQALATIDCAVSRGKRDGATADDVLRVLATVRVRESLSANGAEREA